MSTGRHAKKLGWLARRAQARAARAEQRELYARLDAYFAGLLPAPDDTDNDTQAWDEAWDEGWNR